MVKTDPRDSLFTVRGLCALMNFEENWLAFTRILLIKITILVRLMNIVLFFLIHSFIADSFLSFFFSLWTSNWAAFFIKELIFLAHFKLKRMWH